MLMQGEKILHVRCSSTTQLSSRVRTKLLEGWNGLARNNETAGCADCATYERPRLSSCLYPSCCSRARSASASARGSSAVRGDITNTKQSCYLLAAAPRTGLVRT